MDRLAAPHSLALLEMLAQVDAIHLPFRDRSANAWPAGWVSRWDYARCGVTWRPSSNTGPAARKDNERVAKWLENCGYVARVKPRSRATGVKLTHAGNEYARALVGLPPLDTALKHLAALTTPARRNRWVPECAIDKRPWGPALLALEDELLPVLTRGLAESNADGDRKVYYRATRQGLKAANNPPAPVGPLPAADEDLRDEYLFALANALAALKSEPLPPREIGSCGLPVSWPGDDQEAPNQKDLATMAKVLWGRKAPTTDHN